MARASKKVAQGLHRDTKKECGTWCGDLQSAQRRSRLMLQNEWELALWRRCGWNGEDCGGGGIINSGSEKEKGDFRTPSA